MQNPTLYQKVQETIAIIQDTKEGVLIPIEPPFFVTDIESYNNAMFYWAEIAKYLFRERPNTKFHFFEFIGVSETIFNPYKFKTVWQSWQESPLLSLVALEISKTIYIWNESKIFIGFFVEMSPRRFAVFQSQTTDFTGTNGISFPNIVCFSFDESRCIYQVKIPFAMLLKIGVEL